MWGVSSEGLKTTVFAFQQARSEHPERHGEWEVPRSDDGHDAARLAALVQILGVDFRRDDLTVGLTSGPEDVLHHVQPFDNLGAGLVANFSAFAGEDVSQVFEVALDERGQIVEQVAALDAAGTPPGDERAASGRHGAVDVARRSARIDAKQFRIARGVTVLELALVGGVPLAADQLPPLPNGLVIRHVPPPVIDRNRLPKRIGCRTDRASDA